MNDDRSRHSDILVVGGGVIGLACAYYLSQSGRSVRIIERETMGAGASHGNCGLIFVSDLPPLCAPGAIGHEVIRTLRGTSPLYIKLRPDLSLFFWLLRFAAKCTPSHLAHAVEAREAILRISGELWSELVEREGLSIDFEQRGVLMAFIDPAAMAGYEKTNRLLEPFGLAASFYDDKAIRQLEPALNHRVCGGWYHRADSHVRPEFLMAAWTNVVQRQGVVVNEGCRLEQFHVQNDIVAVARTTSGDFTADQFILAAGVWTPGIARQLNVGIPVVPGKGYSVTMERPAVCPKIPCYLYERNVVATPWQSGYRLGGTMEFSGFDAHLNHRRLGNLETSAALYLQPPTGRQVTERWSGLRPMSVDDLPIIDRMPGATNLYVATGHGMLGLSTATGTGHLVTDMILGRRPPLDPAPYSIARFG